MKAAAPSPRMTLGALGEEAALRTYLGRGYRLVARNWRCRVGELDLVVERRGVLVFCEVKTRAGGIFGGGFEAVTAVKQRKLRQLAELFLLSGRGRAAAVRFDVASVAMARPSAPSVEIFEDAF